MVEVVILSVRVPAAVARSLDERRGKLTRSEAMREAIESWRAVSTDDGFGPICPSAPIPCSEDM